MACRVEYEGRVIPKEKFIHSIIDALGLSSQEVDTSPYLKSIGYNTPQQDVAEGVPAAGLEVVTDQSETLPQGEGEITPLETIDTELLEKQAAPFADDLVKIEVEFSNRGLTIVEDYDDGVQVRDKKGELMDVEDIPEDLIELAGAYEQGVKKIGQAVNVGKVLQEARKRFQGEEAEVVENLLESPLSQAFDLIDSAKRTKKTEKGKMEAGELAITNLGDVGKKAIFIDNNFKDIVSKIRTLKDQKGEPFVKIDCT